LTKKTILILAANPTDTPPLRLDEEVREIDNGLQRAQRRDEFILKQKWATRPEDMRRAMLDNKPNIVHFCGHGEGEAGIAFENKTGNTQLVGSKALAGLFKLFADTVECVLLNACYSETQAPAIAQHIDTVIGMHKAVGDDAALEFAVAFYDALGAGESIEFAYEMGCNAIQMAGIEEEHLIPKLLQRQNTASQKVVDTSTQPEPLSLEEKRQIVDALLACPSIRDNSSRNAVLQQLASEIVDAIQADSRAKIHVTNIVNSCLNFPDGLMAFVETIRFFDGGTRQMQALDAVLKPYKDRL